MQAEPCGKGNTNGTVHVETLCRAEVVQVEKHQADLKTSHGRDVSFAEALDDWLANHSCEWRAERQREYLSRQREEMLRHKWIESEKKGCDQGNTAILDWIQRYAADWRARYQDEQDRAGTEEGNILSEDGS